MFVTSFTVLIVCRTPRGVRGLKLEGSCITSVETVRRTPRGERGLKHNERVGTEGERMSHPSRGAWIETSSARMALRSSSVAPLAGCVD